MQRLLTSLVTASLLVVAATAQCFEPNLGVLAPLTGGQAGYGDDVFFDLQPLGFNFPMAGMATTYSHAHISDNGIIYLTNGVSTTGAMGAGNGYQTTQYFVGDTVGDDPRIAPLFMDLWSDPPNGGGIYVNSTIPGKFVVTWVNMVEWWATTQPGTPALFTFQAQLTATGDVTFYYGSNFQGFTYTAQNFARVGVSEANGVADPGVTDLSLGSSSNLTSFVMYEEFPLGVFDLQDSAITFVYAGTGYVQTLVPCSQAGPAYHQGYGQGCYDISDSLYQFLPDASTAPATLDGQSMVFSPAGNDYLVNWGTGTYVTPVGQTALTIGDDAELAQLLSTPFPTPAGPIGTIYISSNAIISMAANPQATDYTPTAAEMLASPATAFWSWHDYNPTEAGSGPITYFEQTLAGQTIAYITWEGVESWAATAILNPSTLQFQLNLTTGEVAIVWVQIDGDASSPYGSAHLIGYSPGGPSADGGSLDLATALPIVTSSLNVDRMSLSAAPTPVSTAAAGSTVTYTSADMPAYAANTYIGLTVFSLTQNATGFDLGVIGAPGCSAYIGSFDFTVAMTGTTSTNSVNLAIPAGVTPGFEIYAQSLALVPPNSLPNGQNALGMTTSNGVLSVISVY